jgi:hypothetical protein
LPLRLRLPLVLLLLLQLLLLLLLLHLQSCAAHPQCPAMVLLHLDNLHLGLQGLRMILLRSLV